jgi:transcription termination/antitermination protein NusG
MQKNWYIVYTKPKCEKKVAGLLTKRKIENFYPLNSMTRKSARRNRLIQEPLFKCYVFVNACESEIPFVRQIDGVISLLYWMGKPAIVKNDEIEIIKEFLEDHQNVELERTQIDTNDTAHIIDKPIYSVDGKVFALKNKTIKVNLPSLGYTMIAKIEDESIFGREAPIFQNSSFFSS